MMLTIRHMPEKELYSELSLFSQLPVHYKQQLLFVANKNLLYTCINSYCSFWGMKECPSIDSISNLQKLRKYLLCTNMRGKVNLKIHSWADLESLYNSILLQKNKVLGGLLINYILFESDLCPLVQYAFSRLLTLESKPCLRQVIELSLMYLYRIIPVQKFFDRKGFSDRICCGATADVYISKERGLVCKWPKTLASRRYLIKQEAINIDFLKYSDISKFIPLNYIYDEEDNCLFHDFIPGDNGEAILFSQKMLSDEQENSLRDFYDRYAQRDNMDILLDIHPGNFIWNKENKSWVLVDCGAIPAIGSDYYEFSTFKDYYDAVWASWHRRIKDTPIRSIDIENDCVIRQKLNDEVSVEKLFLHNCYEYI